MHKYRLISKKGEGTFSEVLKAQSIKTNKYLAIKCMKNHFDSIDQVNNLREIQALRRLSPNPGVIKLYEVLYDQPTGRLALVFELMDMNIYELIRGRRHYLQEKRIKSYMYQLVKSMDHMHRNGIFHRDIKPENILISDEVLKVADFGSCRGIYSKQPYTEYISTRWYRAPECLLTDGYYGYKMDMWGVGCVMFEIIALFPLFPGTNELDQIERIHNVLGTPPKEILNKFKKYATHMEFNFQEKVGTGIPKMIPHCDEVCVDLIVKLLAYDPEDRLSARQALRHPYFAELRQADKRAEKEKKLQQQQQQQQATNGGASASKNVSSENPETVSKSIKIKVKSNSSNTQNEKINNKKLKNKKDMMMHVETTKTKTIQPHDASSSKKKKSPKSYKYDKEVASSSALPSIQSSFVTKGPKIKGASNHSHGGGAGAAAAGGGGGGEASTQSSSKKYTNDARQYGPKAIKMKTNNATKSIKLSKMNNNNYTNYEYNNYSNYSSSNNNNHSSDSSSTLSHIKKRHQGNLSYSKQKQYGGDNNNNGPISKKRTYGQPSLGTKSKYHNNSSGIHRKKVSNSNKYYDGSESSSTSYHHHHKNSPYKTKYLSPYSQKYINKQRTVI